MKVVITRPDKYEIRIWRTDNPDFIVKIGNWYVQKHNEEYNIVSLDFTRDNFKEFFGFLPRIGSKKLYQLNLKLFKDMIFGTN